MSCLAPAGRRDDWICLGDVWADRDWRNPGREVTVLMIDDLSVPERSITGLARTGTMVRRTRIKARRMIPTSTGYELVTKSCPLHKEHA